MNPFTTELRKIKTKRSRLMIEKAKQSNAFQWCPFGCEGQECFDSNGYCHHLVGFTVPGDKTKMHKFLPPRAKKNVDDPDEVCVGEGLRLVTRRTVDVPKGATLEEITVCFRVYMADAKPFAQSVKAPPDVDGDVDEPALPAPKSRREAATV